MPPPAEDDLADDLADDDLGDDLDDAPPLPPKSAVRGGAKSSDPKADKKQAKKSGGSTVGLWLLLIVLLLAATAGAVYVFQDTLIKYWPPAEDYLIQAKFRHEKPGAGFEIRRLGEIERGVHDNTEVVIIRGIIINVSNKTRVVPPMKLVLLDKSGKPLQEKIDKPPVASLDPAATSSFKIQLDRPDAEARSIVLEFVEMPPEAPKPEAAAPPQGGESHEGSMTPPPTAAAPVPPEAPKPEAPAPPQPVTAAPMHEAEPKEK